MTLSPWLRVQKKVERRPPSVICMDSSRKLTVVVPGRRKLTGTNNPGYEVDTCQQAPESHLGTHPLTGTEKLKKHFAMVGHLT